MQIHLHMTMVIEDRMREAGIDPDKEPDKPRVLETDADFANFFG